MIADAFQFLDDGMSIKGLINTIEVFMDVIADDNARLAVNLVNAFTFLKDATSQGCILMLKGHMRILQNFGYYINHLQHFGFLQQLFIKAGGSIEDVFADGFSNIANAFQVTIDL